MLKVSIWTTRQFQKTLLVDAGSPGLELLRGSYDITVVGSPVTGSGGIYVVPDTVTHIEIAEGNVTINGESFSFKQNERITYRASRCGLYCDQATGRDR